MLERLRRRSQDERGAVLIIVAVLMVAFMASAALAIDLGSYAQAQRQAQSAADAGALAASDDLPGTTASAPGDATTYAQKNFPGATVSVPAITAGSSQVTVSVTASTPTFFGKFLGLTNEKVSATAVAKRTGGTTLCTTPGTGCYAIFAQDTSCTSGHYSIQFQGGGNTITGGILSNGSVSPGGGGSTWGPSAYGPASSACTWTPAGGTFPPPGSPVPQPNPPPPLPYATTWPVDYSVDFPPCTTTCPGPGGTPSFCSQSSTLATWTLGSLTTGSIYCGVGGGNAKTPSTWTGQIIVGAGSVGSASNPLEATYVGGTVTVQGGGDFLASCGRSPSAAYSASLCAAATVPAPTTPNYPLFYAVATSATAFNGGGGGNIFYGDIFAPNGTITFPGGGDTTAFLEGKDVIYTGGGMIGDGPTTAGTGTSSAGSSSLIQ